MAQYFSPTVIPQPIPIIDMTPLESLMLGQIFDADPIGAALYFHASEGPRESIELSVAELAAALSQSSAIDSRAASYIAEQLAKAPPGAIQLTLDLNDMPWETIFQDVVRRSSTLEYVTAITSFTCSTMRPDGFGGMAVLVTTDAILGKSTKDIVEDLLADRASAVGAEHVLLRLREDAVRHQVGEIIGSDTSLTALTADGVTAADVRAGCLTAAESTDLSEERGSAEFRAALAAIVHAEHRIAPPR